MNSNVITLNAELFARVCRLIVGVKHWAYQLHTIALGYFLVVTTPDALEVTSFYVEDMHFSQTPLCISIPSELIEMMAHALLKDCKGDLTLKEEEVGISFNLQGIELARLGLTKPIIVNNLTRVTDSPDAALLVEFITHTSRWTQFIYLDELGALALDHTNSFLATVNLTLWQKQTYVITAPKFLYSMVSRLKLEEAPVALDEKDDRSYLSFHSEVKLSSKDVVRLVVSYRLTNNVIPLDDLRAMLQETLNEGREIKLTEGFMVYAKNHLKEEKVKPTEVIQLTKNFALTSRFFNVMFSTAEALQYELRIFKDRLSVAAPHFVYLAKLSHKPSYTP